MPALTIFKHEGHSRYSARRASKQRLSLGSMHVPAGQSALLVADPQGCQRPFAAATDSAACLSSTPESLDSLTTRAILREHHDATQMAVDHAAPFGYPESYQSGGQ